ncbi:MAG: DUF302 domain-containing protein [Hyphomicrobiales bacterium]
MRKLPLASALVFMLGAFSMGAALAETFAREGWVSIETKHAFADLNKRMTKAIKANKMGRIVSASASAGAKGRKLVIPGNRVIGVYNNFFAVRMLKASKAAGIEAPIIFYLTENEDATTTLSYKKPSFVFAPYYPAATPDLKVMAEELDVIFAKIAADAAAE